MTETRVGEILAQAAHNARDDRGHRGIWLAFAVIMAGLLAVVLAVIFTLHSVSALTARADANARDAQALAAQVKGLGGTPVVQPPAPGATGAPGRDGVDGRPGTTGASGTPGRDGKDGTSPPCLTEPPQCRGANGVDGAGVTGTPGKDGRDGKDGAPGKDGTPGKDGRDGAPPAGWAWTDGDGRTQSCTRDGGTDQAPHYGCTAEPPASTTPPSGGVIVIPPPP